MLETPHRPSKVIRVKHPLASLAMTLRWNGQLQGRERKVGFIEKTAMRHRANCNCDIESTARALVLCTRALMHDAMAHACKRPGVCGGGCNKGDSLIKATVICRGRHPCRQSLIAASVPAAGAVSPLPASHTRRSDRHRAGHARSPTHPDAAVQPGTPAPARLGVS